jgi:hypothetical protein
MSGRQMSILIGLVVLLAIVSNSLYVVNERERAVLLKFGEVVSTDIEFSVMKLQLLALVASLMAASHLLQDATDNPLLYPLYHVRQTWSQNLDEWASFASLSSLVIAAVTQDAIMCACTLGLVLWNAWTGNRVANANVIKVWTSCVFGIVGNALSMFAKNLGAKLDVDDSRYEVYRICVIYTVISMQLVDIAVNHNRTAKTVGCFTAVCAVAFLVLDITAEQFLQNFLPVIFVVKIIESYDQALAVCSRMLAVAKGDIGSKICAAGAVTFILYEAYVRLPETQCGWNCLIEWITYAVANCMLAARVRLWRV